MSELWIIMTDDEFHRRFFLCLFERRPQLRVAKRSASIKLALIVSRHHVHVDVDQYVVFLYGQMLNEIFASAQTRLLSIERHDDDRMIGMVFPECLSDGKQGRCARGIVVRS